MYTKEQMLEAMERVLKAYHINDPYNLEDYLPIEEAQITKWEYEFINDTDFDD